LAEHMISGKNNICCKCNSWYENNPLILLAVKLYYWLI